MQTRSYPDSSKIEISLDYDSLQNEQTIELPLQTFPEDIVIVAIGLNFVSGRLSESIGYDKKWLPGKIIGAIWKNGV